MIEVKKLVKTFDGFTALDSATLTVPKGAVYGLVGPNGAGKSTLLRHITGVYKQDSGQVLVNGVPVFENRHAKERIVSIPDDWFYYNQSTIREMAKLYAGMYPQFDGGRFEKLRELFHLPEKKPIRRMSKGMQRQAAFWITMSCLPEYLVLDEPVDGLDPVMRRQVWQVLLDDVSARGTTVLLSSHNLRELEDVCDHVGLLHWGGALCEDDLDRLKLGITRLQFALADPADFETVRSGLNLLKCSQQGKLFEMTVRGTETETLALVQRLHPLFCETLPITLEELFISEMEVAGYDINKVI